MPSVIVFNGWGKMVIFVFRLFFVKFMETIATICQRMWKLGYYEAALLPMAFVMNSVLMADLMIDVLTDGTQCPCWRMYGTVWYAYETAYGTGEGC